MINILKNPVIIGLIGATLTYIYFLWSNNQYKDEKNKQYDTTTVIITTICVGIIIWFIASMYLTDDSSDSIKNSNVFPLDNTSQASANDTVDMLYSSSDPTKSFHLIGKGLNIPHKLPDVFIETI